MKTQEELKSHIQDLRRSSQDDFSQVSHSEDRIYAYLWFDTTDFQKSKFGEHWVPAGKNPWDDITAYVRRDQAKAKFRFDEEIVQLVKIWDITEYALKYKMHYKNSKVDNHIRNKIGRVHNSEWHDLDPIEMSIRVSEVLAKEGQPLPEVALSTAQFTSLEKVLGCFDRGEKVLMGELFARFGKTIFSGAVAIETETPLTIVASYVKTVFSSFASQLVSYEQFRNIVHIDTQDDDYQNKINEALVEGKQVFAYLSLCNGSKRQERIDFLYSREYQRLTLVDEADLGAHRSGQAEPLIAAQGKEDRVILLTGTNADRAVKCWGDRVDSLISYTYYEALVDKKESQSALEKVA